MERYGWEEGTEGRGEEGQGETEMSIVSGAHWPKFYLLTQSL